MLKKTTKRLWPFRVYFITQTKLFYPLIFCELKLFCHCLLTFFFWSRELCFCVLHSADMFFSFKTHLPKVYLYKQTQASIPNPSEACHILQIVIYYTIKKSFCQYLIHVNLHYFLIRHQRTEPSMVLSSDALPKESNPNPPLKIGVWIIFFRLNVTFSLHI